MPSSRPAKAKRMLSAELPDEPPSLLAGGLPLFCCPVPPPDDTVGVALAVPVGVEPTVGVAALSVGDGVGVGDGEGVGDGVGEGVGDGVGDGVGVALQLQDTVALLCPLKALKVIVALAGQVTLPGMLMTTFFWACGSSVPPVGMMVMPAMPWLLAIQKRVLELLLLTVTLQLRQLFVNAVGETEMPPGASGCIYGAASATGGCRASNGTKIARTHRAAKAMHTGKRESLEV